MMSRRRRRRRRVALTLPPASVIPARPGSPARLRGSNRPVPRMRAAGGENGKRLIDQLPEDLGGALLARDKADALAGHQRTAFDVAVDHRAAQGTGPEMLDLELRFSLRQLAPREPVDDPALHRDKPLRGRIGERANRDHRKARIELDRGDRIARRSADEGLLEARDGRSIHARRQSGCRAGRRPRPSRDRPASPRRGRCRRRQRPARRGDAAGSPAPAPRSRPARYARRPRCPR